MVWREERDGRNNGIILRSEKEKRKSRTKKAEPALTWFLRYEASASSQLMSIYSPSVHLTFQYNPSTTTKHPFCIPRCNQFHFRSLCSHRGYQVDSPTVVAVLCLCPGSLQTAAMPIIFIIAHFRSLVPKLNNLLSKHEIESLHSVWPIVVDNNHPVWKESSLTDTKHEGAVLRRHRQNWNGS